MLGTTHLLCLIAWNPALLLSSGRHYKEKCLVAVQMQTTQLVSAASEIVMSSLSLLLCAVGMCVALWFHSATQLNVYVAVGHTVGHMGYRQGSVVVRLENGVGGQPFQH